MSRASTDGADGSVRAPSTHTADAPRMECGADYDALVAQVAERRAPAPEAAAHQHACPHCRAAIAELEELWAPVSTLTGEQVRAPAGLVESIMARVRELPRHSSYAVLAGDGPGATRIAGRVVGAIARRAALGVPGVTAAVGGGPRRRDVMSGEGTAVAVSGSHVVVEVALVVAFGAPVLDVAAQVRAAVIEHVSRLTDLTATAVDVSVVDLEERPDGR